MDVPKGILIETNKVYFNQSLIQLILNACRYTSKGQIRLKVEAEKSKVLIEVSDTGVGIDQDLVDQTINQLESSNFQEIDTFSTLGLGIVGVHNFCKRIGATFICKSQANKGTVIKIHHPVLLKAKTDTLNKVTIVSNNEPNVKNIQASVQKIKGWQCDITEDIEGIANEQPRLAIIDLDHTPKPFKVISSLITSQSECDFILLVDGKFIDVSLVLFSNDPNLYKTSFITLKNMLPPFIYKV